MPSHEPLRLRFDAFELDEAQARLLRDGTSLPMPPKAFALLCALARRPDQLVTKTELLDAVWGHQYVSDSVLKTTVSELRAALGDDAKQPRYVETASRRGYRFIGVPAAARTSLATRADAPGSSSPALDAAAAAAAPSPSDPGRLVGRQRALERLRAAWARAGSGRRQVVWVAGEAGIGKTTLVEHFVAGIAGARVAHGQCVEQHGTGEPYLPVLEALAALTRADGALVAQLRSIAPTWLLHLPWLVDETERESLRREIAGSGQARMLRELGELLDRQSQQRPLLLVTEDLHWSDHATVQLLDHVARRRGPARLMWLATFRIAELIADDHPLRTLRHELKLHRLAEEIALEPFSEREVADYLAQRLPEREPAEAFVRALHARTDGLPLFVANVVDELGSQGRLQAVADGAEAVLQRLQVPESLAGVIDRQFARLVPEHRQLLEAASVCGGEFRTRTLADALQRDAAWVDEHCGQLLRRQQWLSSLPVVAQADGTLDAHYAFGHALYRQVFYQHLGEATRAQLHRRVADSLRSARDAGIAVRAAEIASHYELSHDAPSALRHYADAVENALDHFAPVEAEQLSGHALGLLPACPPGDERDALELSLQAPRGVACAQLYGVASPQAKAAFERAQALCDRLPSLPPRAPALSGLGWVYVVVGDYAPARALAERMHALALERDDAVLRVCALNLLGYVASFQGQLLQATDWMLQGLQAAATLGGTLDRARFVIDPEVSMRCNVSLPLACLGRYADAIAQLDGARRRADAVRQPVAQMLVQWCAGIVGVNLGDVAAVRTAAERLGAVVADHGVAQGEGPARWLRGWAAAHEGDPDGGHALILAGHAFHHRLGMHGGCPLVLGYAAEALMLGGRHAEAEAQADAALALAERIGERIDVPALLVLLARARHALGRPDEAVDALDRALRIAGERGASGQQLVAELALCEIRHREDDVAALRATLGRLDAACSTATMRRAAALLAGPASR